MNDIIKGMGNLNCYRERGLALELWNALYNNKLTRTAEEYFDTDTAEVYFNPSSGYVFLSDVGYNTVMINDNGDLDLFITLSYNGQEGFLSELLEELKNNNIEHKEDIEQLYSYCDNEQKEQYKEYFQNIE